MEKAVALALSDTATSFIVALQQTFHGVNADEATLQKAFEEVELYIKGRDRIDLIHAVQDHEVHVFGSTIDTKDWKKHFKNKPNVIVHDPIPYPETKKVMQQSKIVLNSCIKNQYGAHERIFCAAACEAVVVTNDNPFLREHFSDGRNIVLYQRNNFAKLNDTINHLLADEKARRRIAKAGRKEVMSHHTWAHRVKRLLKEILPIVAKMNSSHKSL